MNLLYYFADDKTYMSKWQYEHFFDELEHHDVHIDLFNPLKYKSLDEANEKLLYTLKNNSKYDLFMNCCPSNLLYEDTMRHIDILPLPKLLICFDNLQSPHIHKAIMPYFDLVWLTSRENEDSIRRWGAKTIFMPYAANPFKFYPTESRDINKVCFIGTPYGTRCSKINSLIHNGVSVDVFFGSKNFSEVKKSKTFMPTIPPLFELLSILSTDIGRKMAYSRLLAIKHKQILDMESSFLNRGYSLPFDKMIESYSDYALDLNVLELRNTYLLKNPIYKLHLRTFEIPMCGGIQFTTYNNELAEYFEEDKEIVFYRSEEELIDKAKYYMDTTNAKKRASIRVAARKRAELEHTWWCRFEKAFNLLLLNK